MFEIPLELRVPAKAIYVGNSRVVNQDVQRQVRINACTSALTLMTRINIVSSLINMDWLFWMSQKISNIIEAPR